MFTFYFHSLHNSSIIQTYSPSTLFFNSHTNNNNLLHILHSIPYLHQNFKIFSLNIYFNLLSPYTISFIIIFIVMSQTHPIHTSSFSLSITFVIIFYLWSSSHLFIHSHSIFHILFSSSLITFSPTFLSLSLHTHFHFYFNPLFTHNFLNLPLHHHHQTPFHIIPFTSFTLTSITSSIITFINIFQLVNLQFTLPYQLQLSIFDIYYHNCNNQLPSEVWESWLGLSLKAGPSDTRSETMVECIRVL